MKLPAWRTAQLERKASRPEFPPSSRARTEDFGERRQTYQDQMERRRPALHFGDLALARQQARPPAIARHTEAIAAQWNGRKMKMNERPIYLLMLRAEPGVDAVRSLRALLKAS